MKKQGASLEPDLLATSLIRTREKGKNQQSTSPQTIPVMQEQQVFSVENTCIVSGNYKIKVNAKQIPPPSKPTESNAVGGLSAGGKSPWKPITGIWNQF